MRTSVAIRLRNKGDRLMVKKFRKKPVVIKAIQYTGRNVTAIQGFTHGQAGVLTHGDDSIFAVDTLEGTMVIDIGDWIIKGVKGEFYPCKPDIFEMTYEAVDG